MPHGIQWAIAAGVVVSLRIIVDCIAFVDGPWRLYFPPIKDDVLIQLMMAGNVSIIIFLFNASAILRSIFSFSSGTSTESHGVDIISKRRRMSMRTVLNTHREKDAPSLMTHITLGLIGAIIYGTFQTSYYAAYQIIGAVWAASLTNARIVVQYLSYEYFWLQLIDAEKPPPANQRLYLGAMFLFGLSFIVPLTYQIVYGTEIIDNGVPSIYGFLLMIPYLFFYGQDDPIQEMVHARGCHLDLFIAIQHLPMAIIAGTIGLQNMEVWRASAPTLLLHGIVAGCADSLWYLCQNKAYQYSSSTVVTLIQDSLHPILTVLYLAILTPVLLLHELGETSYRVHLICTVGAFVSLVFSQLPSRTAYESIENKS